MFLVLIIVYDDISSSEKSDIESLKATVKKTHLHHLNVLEAHSCSSHKRNVEGVNSYPVARDLYL